MWKFIVCVGSLLIHQIGIAHPGHHHSLGSAEVHSLFSWDQLIWVVVLGILVALFLRSRQQDAMRHGEIISKDGEIEINVGRFTIKVVVINQGNRPIQIGSYYHFFEVNKAVLVIK